MACFYPHSNLRRYTEERWLLSSLNKCSRHPFAYSIFIQLRGNKKNNYSNSSHQNSNVEKTMHSTFRALPFISNWPRPNHLKIILRSLHSLVKSRHFHIDDLKWIIKSSKVVTYKKKLWHMSYTKIISEVSIGKLQRKK